MNHQSANYCRCLLSGELVFNPTYFPCVVWWNQNCITFAKTMVRVNIFFIAQKKWPLHLRNLKSATSKQLSNSPISQPFDCLQTLFHQEVSNEGLPGLSQVNRRWWLTWRCHGVWEHRVIRRELISSTQWCQMFVKAKMGCLAPLGWFLYLHLSNNIDNLRSWFEDTFFRVRQKSDLHSLSLQLKAEWNNCSTTKHAEEKLISGNRGSLLLLQQCISVEMLSIFVSYRRKSFVNENCCKCACDWECFAFLLCGIHEPEQNPSTWYQPFRRVLFIHVE